jgi:hypothetical protein
MFNRGARLVEIEIVFSYLEKLQVENYFKFLKNNEYLAFRETEALSEALIIRFLRIAVE